MKLQVKLHAEDLHHTYCRHFQTNLLFWWSILDDTKIHRTPIYRKTFIRASRDRNLGIYIFFLHLITCLHTGLCTSYFAPLKYLLAHLCTLTYLIVHLVQRKKYFRIEGKLSSYFIHLFLARDRRSWLVLFITNTVAFNFFFTPVVKGSWSS